MASKSKGTKYSKDKKICILCGSITTFKRQGKWEQWYRYETGYICITCYMKLHGKKTITFGKTRHPSFEEDPRTYTCSLCGFEGSTDMHHDEYHEDQPLKDTRELCKSCHSKETIRLGQLKRGKNGRFIKNL